MQPNVFFTTIRDYSGVFAIRHYSLLAIRDFSLFAVRVAINDYYNYAPQSDQKPSYKMTVMNYKSSFNHGIRLKKHSVQLCGNLINVARVELQAFIRLFMCEQWLTKMTKIPGTLYSKQTFKKEDI